MKLFRVLPFLVLPLACSEPGFQPSPGTKLVRASSPIQGGTTDSTSTNVVGILLNTSQGAGVCTGSLIAPNLVLTARHCVGDIGSNLSSCSSQPFSSPAAASSFRITTSYNAIDPIFNGSGGWKYL